MFSLVIKLSIAVTIMSIGNALHCVSFLEFQRFKEVDNPLHTIKSHSTGNTYSSPIGIGYFI